MSNKEIFPLQFNDSAVNQVKKIIANENNPHLKLRVYIIGGGCNGFQYGFTLDEKINKKDIVIKKQGVSLLIDNISLLYLAGSSVDYSESIEGSSFRIINLKTKNTCSCGLSFNI
ncbi:Iron-sulfur cluster insertion protein ErpA [Candidatus Mikella endobia]|uniref:Iron-sulfur cluster insertion protein ErpA n=1 Tax=Candidatus Mikella endobia TaxID=1778264 RepID=A0A143WSE7_9ENTR|nr:iron-sulfur cluster insertion protein ErpA [Candidatus Mikella endobia]CUX95809.1 Iron-sulfur cluster insertion protein ErpA [Candidatus Mikella endobia]